MFCKLVDSAMFLIVPEAYTGNVGIEFSYGDSVKIGVPPFLATQAFGFWLEVFRLPGMSTVFSGKVTELW